MVLEKMDLLELRKKTISNIHESKFKFVIVSSGGGSNAIGLLLFERAGFVQFVL